MQTGSVAKALLLLGCFDCGTEVVGVTEIARRSALPKSTAYRILNVLVEAGFVHRLRSGYQLSERLTTLGGSQAEHVARALRPLLLPCLVDLHEKIAAPVALTVMEGERVRCVERVHNLRQAALAQMFPDGVPACASAAGKVLLAFSGCHGFARDVVNGQPLGDEIDQIRTLGFLAEKTMHPAGMATIVAPVFGPARFAVAALSVIGSSAEFRMRVMTSQLRAAAHNCGAVVKTMKSARLNVSPVPAKATAS